MNQQQICRQLEAWLVDFVEKPNPMLNGWAPCPFARKSRVTNRFDIAFATADTLEATIESAAQQLDRRDVIAVCIDPAEISAEDLAHQVAQLNQQLMPDDVLLLEDHPAEVEIINGVHMNFGACAIVFVQQLSKINEASEQLKRGGYYDCWSQENLDSVVNWRVNNSNEILPNQSQ
jgi:HPt (histidine-containing phosphotransfer) domain-containing protein